MSIAAEQPGLYDPLIIFPEGCTTNSTSLIQFKKGAFAPLLNIKPQIFKYHSCFQPASSGILDSA